MLRFSIIIPVYNVAPYLRECLDSVLAQAYTDWEAICIDDGSTDASGLILDEYAAGDERFRVVHQANTGVSVARNKGMSMACGEWVAFLDADDFVEKDWLARAVSEIEADFDLDVIVFNAKILLPDGGTRSFAQRLRSRELLEFECSRICREKGFSEALYVVWNKFIRRSFLAEHKLRFEPRIALMEDVFFSEWLFYVARRILILGDMCAYNYRLRESSAIHQISVERALQIVDLAVAKIGLAERLQLCDAILDACHFTRTVIFRAYSIRLPLTMRIRYLWRLSRHEGFNVRILHYACQHCRHGEMLFERILIAMPKWIAFSLMLCHVEKAAIRRYFREHHAKNEV